MSKGDVRRRLQEAALALFQERGYDGTTATEIAARVGVTERTFFRYFASKRDVLFDEDALHEGLSAAIAEASDGLSPMALLRRAFVSLIPLLERNRPLSEPARAIIAVTPVLQERYLAKAAATSMLLAEALRMRGVDQDVATLAAASGMGVIGQAMESWFNDPSAGLGQHLDRAFQAWSRLS
ncbi:TetR family transcriptional regulator [Sphingomonas oryzagri]|jgi:AcrR family transcriptional regulator|uniref:TetR family transcriptional regulator n=1 Tax=Sphingomonas oryzagri TaxID=3042314 RepID=A0ABT6MYV3_9SPHN|nr:TetR family transcriptional regulator [Sphingomonas oryzagri]MDH7637654.1 TetR family transcriptional regulator [Sphingomonas oryzagri]